MIKLIGGFLLAFTGIVAALSFCSFQRKKLSVMDFYITLLLYIKGQVGCYGLPLSDILAGRGEDKDFVQMLQGSKIYLDEETYRLLEQFYFEFGSVYREEQLLRCDYYIQALSERRRLFFDDLPARRRVGSALCLCSALGMIIILL